ncbi:DUF2069 domain-containing protein [bacterium]|jgi:uncharacterized membrane protein|nr:DUF2069 domain-containing protein [Gammaproteobacteria bacterium]MCH1551395.1 DUF2069 domain-containing protein [Pseudomonadales bacterium]MDB3937047.1 DUF2069 domain-containing protein [bacterium]
MKGWLFVAFIMLGSIVGVTGLRQFFVEPLTNPIPNAIWFFLQLTPLLLPLPGLMRLKLASTFIMCMTSTLYFIHGVYVISDPKLALLGSVEIIFSIGLCATTAYLVRQIREAQAVD